MNQNLNDIREAMSEVLSELREEVVVHGTADETVPALIGQLQDISGDDDEAEFETVIRIAESDASKLGTRGEAVLTATIGGERWNITKVHPPRHGLIPVTVRRSLSENTHSNKFDINDEQAQWG